MLKPLTDHTFDDLFVRSLPADPIVAPHTRQVPDAAYSRVTPTPVRAPRLLAWSDVLGAQLGIARPDETGAVVEALAGNRVLPGMQPYSARYGGHQFGHWAGQLGDGRAITLGELIDSSGQRQELQLKGAGRTPYSRHADGRAVLRSSLREFLCSEAMFHLGIPTTRALSLVATGEPVVRDMFYDGRPRAEPGAIVCRVAPSFLRFGNFEILAAHGETALRAQLLDWLIAHHYPHLGGPHARADWFRELCERTADLVCGWMRVGFVHGVINTDNMSALGLTIDYGPYGWLEDVDPAWTPNTTDAEGRRYCYGQQPQIAQWNLTRLAGAVDGALDEDALRAGLEAYNARFETARRSMLAGKLGVPLADSAADEAFTVELFRLLQASETDWTLFFRLLAEVPLDAARAGDATTALAPLAPAFYAPDGPPAEHAQALTAWLATLGERVAHAGEPARARTARMHRHNPRYVPRNYLAQLAIDAAEQGDTAPLHRLLQVLQRPYDDQPGHDELAARRPEWARHRAGCSALSCSS